jgi:hypothetical protein
MAGKMMWNETVKANCNRASSNALKPSIETLLGVD